MSCIRLDLSDSKVGVSVYAKASVVQKSLELSLACDSSHLDKSKHPNTRFEDDRKSSIVLDCRHQIVAVAVSFTLAFGHQSFSPILIKNAANRFTGT
jgi:hypothetical protein